MAGLAAAIVLVATGAVLLKNAATTGPIPAALPPARILARGPEVNVLAADKLAPQIRAGALNWRASGDHYDLELATALKPYSVNNFKAAAAALERLAARYPDKAEPLLYLGVCKLLMDRPVEAERTLRRAVPLGGPGEEVRWYLAVAVYQNGRRADARQLLARICRENGARAADACLARDQIGAPQ
jgi:predicted Zn-dependent protease